MCIARSIAVTGVLFCFMAPADASTIAWTTWTSKTGSNPGTVKGSVTLPSGKVKITYKGQVGSGTVLGPGYPSWGPASTFSGGSVGNPPGPGNQISLYGGESTSTNTISFSKPVTDPVIAIWSLGHSDTQAAFKFKGTPPLSFESGGPSSEYGGQAITVKKSTVQGQEGNGTIQLKGTYTKIQFTTPTYENYYSFTVGLPD